MGAIINASINVAKMPKEKFVKGKDGNVWYNFTISINDELSWQKKKLKKKSWILSQVLKQLTLRICHFK